MTITINSDREFNKFLECLKGSTITINIHIQKVGNITDSTVSNVNTLSQCKVKGEK